MELLKKALSVIPAHTRLHLRSDSACYNKDVVQFCEANHLTFTIAADMTAPLLALIADLPEEAWHPWAKDEDVAQVYYQPTGWTKAYRFVVMRKAKTPDMFGRVWSYRAVVTRLDRGNPQWILKRHRRHGNVENGIKELKSLVFAGLDAVSGLPWQSGVVSLGGDRQQPI